LGNHLIICLGYTPSAHTERSACNEQYQTSVRTFFEFADDNRIPGSVSTLQSTLNRAEQDAFLPLGSGVFGDETRDQLRATIVQKSPEPIIDGFSSSDNSIFDDEVAA